MSRNFACGCSDKSIAEAEAVLLEVLPGLKPEEAKILTGEQTPYSYALTKRNEETGEWEKTGEKKEGVIDEHRDMERTETLLIAIDDLTRERSDYARSWEMSIGMDQWCGVSVKTYDWHKRDAGVAAEEHERWYSSQYDFGLLPYALAFILREMKERESEYTATPGPINGGQ